ncbi:MAG: hypothetical protein EXX96DRAFT_590015 [Benjaminiella poitrasii]|nr:MAG: hypothetical protein EXX96DRAFT_590015 [Benjaminiella poitrasii]
MSFVHVCNLIIIIIIFFFLMHSFQNPYMSTYILTYTPSPYLFSPLFTSFFFP